MNTKPEQTVKETQTDMFLMKTKADFYDIRKSVVSYLKRVGYRTLYTTIVCR